MIAQYQIANEYNIVTTDWSRGIAFPTRLHVGPAKIQIRLRIRAVWSESSLGILLVAKAPSWGMQSF